TLALARLGVIKIESKGKAGLNGKKLQTFAICWGTGRANHRWTLQQALQQLCVLLILRLRSRHATLGLGDDHVDCFLKHKYSPVLCCRLPQALWLAIRRTVARPLPIPHFDRPATALFKLLAGH